MDAISILKGESRPDLLTEETLVDLFRASARKYPNKTALIFKNTFLTYNEIDRWSDAFAIFLQTKGVGSGKTVGLWYPRGIELHIAIIGIIKSGAAYVPLDREMPSERVIAVLNEVGASACISKESLDINCSVFDVIPMPADDVVLPNLIEGPKPDNWAYVLYTSGSTGKPKGIPITQRQITHLVKSEQCILNIKSDDRVYQGFSVSFDMWCEETWISYNAGASLWVADATTAKSIDEIGEY
jgi:non-ribosomal peptide synthetase component F